ncbi:hypothetical protein [Bacillus sp. Cr_A10]|uniref:hypothetical protein n=1 Tax=Bacillus sp. Cr_A10 TaxID=3033993 RepID=UPI0023DB5D73|nr:hypothetical protein [Bacillus sp. Cr_A10]MDF2065089.1 hypothetical protein [Bacillus sp. Cr_A10]
MKEKYITELEVNLRNNSLMGYIGVSLVFLGYLNTQINISSEYMIGISFAAFFFVFAEFISLKPKLTKIYLKLYAFLLFLGVSSFTVLPIILMSVKVNNEYFITLSESMSIISLGVVLGILNLKSIQNNLNEYDRHIKIMNDYKGFIDKYEERVNRYEELTDKLLKENERLNKQIK